MKDVGTKANQAVSRKMATEGMVLLQNKQMLPLDPEEDIAVIGPLADVWYKDWYSGIPPYFVTPLDGIRSQSNVAFERAALQAHIGMADGSYLGVDNGGVVCLQWKMILQKDRKDLSQPAKMSRLGGLFKKFSILRMYRRQKLLLQNSMVFVRMSALVHGMERHFALMNLGV